MLKLDKALQEFEKEDPVKARLVVLRYFGGLSIEQVCETMNISRSRPRMAVAVPGPSSDTTGEPA